MPVKRKTRHKYRQVRYRRSAVMKEFGGSIVLKCASFLIYIIIYHCKVK